MTKDQIQTIVKLMEDVRREYDGDTWCPSPGIKPTAVHVSGFERASVCVRDCLLNYLQDGEQLLKDTVTAWYRDIEDRKNNRGQASENRHGAWVPAIPL